MNQHSKITKSSAKTMKARTPSLSKLHTLVNSARQAGRAVGKKGASAAEPLVQSIKQEQPATIAKMALAALTPQLISAGIRFALRNPVLTIIGVGLVAVIATGGEDAAET
jgi:hypothetical protein